MNADADRTKLDRAQECLDRGLVLAMFGEAAQATRFYRKALLLDPKNVLGHYMLGLALMNQGNTDDAIEQLREATEIDGYGSRCEWARAEAERLLSDHGVQNHAL